MFDVDDQQGYAQNDQILSRFDLIDIKYRQS